MCLHPLIFCLNTPNSIPVSYTHLDVYKRQGRDISNGNFLTPAIFTECNDSMEICREEIFGPVLSILSFDSEDEVIERANNTSFGLSAGVFTNDIKRGHRVIHQLQAGTCWINNYNITPIPVSYTHLCIETFLILL